VPAIGPTGRGNILVAWDPIAQKEKWRGLAAGFNQGGSLSTAGDLVFSSVNNRLLAYRADTGEQLLDLQTGLSQAGPPMTFMLDGKQYIVVAGGPAQAAGAGGRGGGRGQAPAAPAAPARPSHLLAFVLDGKATLPQ
jgi:quinohemoprotein ethanol dehydrogenase